MQRGWGACACRSRGVKVAHNGGPRHAQADKQGGSMVDLRIGRGAALGLCLLGLSSAAGAEEASLSEPQYRLVTRIEEALEAGQPQEAERLLTEARAMGDHPWLKLLMGEASLAQGRCAEAKRFAVDATDPDPWAKPGTDWHESQRRELLEQIAGQCPARLRLDCGPKSQAFVDGAATACGVEVVIEAGVHVLTARDERGQEARPRRIQADGEALTELKLYPAGGEYGFARWEPTSPQPIPAQDPLGEAYSEGLFMPIFMVTTGSLLVGLGGLTIWEAAKVKTEGLEGEELREAELLEIQGWSYGVMGVVVGLVNFGLGLVFWPEAPPPSKWPEFSVSPLGDGWSVGLGARF